MDIYSEIQRAVTDALTAIGAEELTGEDGKVGNFEGFDFTRVAVDSPRETAHGDLATNAAIVLTRQARCPPRKLAESLAERLRANSLVSSVEVAGPGFVNITLSEEVWHRVLTGVLAAGADYGTGTSGADRKINVEYVSANPTGPLHIGHARGAVFGDALAALLEKTGHDVCREYYVNDAGAQIDTLARSLHLRYREALGEKIGGIPENFYPGVYLVGVGRDLAERDGDRWRAAPEEEWLPVLRGFAVEAMMELIRGDLASLGVTHDIFISERALIEDGKVDDVVAFLQANNLLYAGVLEAPKGGKANEEWEEWEARPQTLFRATAFGDDVDRPIRKSDGSWTYFASDIAYHRDKYRRGFSELIDVWGADHAGYIKRLTAATKAATKSRAGLDVKICQMVRVMKNGKPLTMSKRAGTFVTVRDLVDEVGADVVRFMMLTRKNDAALDFDLALVMEQSRNNPVFYVQYAHARCCSLERIAAEAIPDIDLSAEALGNADLARLGHPAERDMIRILAAWPNQLVRAAAAHEPHRIAFYLGDLAASFHLFWTQGGREDASLRFVVADNPELTRARMALAFGVRAVIASGLGIFGIEPAQEL